MIIIAVFLFLGLKNLYVYSFSGKQRITVKTSSSFSAGSNLDAVVSVTKIKGNTPINSNLKVELVDSNKKKVKGVSGNFKMTDESDSNISLRIPDDIERGNYILKILSRSGLLYDVAEVPISIVTPESQTGAIISLDKGIYKPGDEINFRALVISKIDNTPVKTDVNIYIFDGNDNKVYSEKTNTSDFGIISGKFQLADEVNSGTYRLCVDVGGKEINKTFNVNPYITPKFEVSIITDKENYLVDDEVQITVNAKYFFGEPVANASVEGSINGKEVKGLTDSEGNFKYNYKMTEAGKVNLEFSVVDSSNYMIEESKNISCGTDVFEIEVLPEFGNLSSYVNNDIYVFTKKANGENVKTYSTITIGNISKQLISDENGVGKVTFTKDEMSSLKNTISTEIKIEAKDMDGNIVNKSTKFDFVDEYSLLKTDKIKYNTGNDIQIDVISKVDSTNNSIYVFKGKELLKTITFDGNSTKINLGDVSGLIDIYIQNNNYRYDDRFSFYSSSNYNRMNYSKKTIFIKPDKELNINLTLEKDEYKPGETLNAELSTLNNENQPIDTALLISILDKSILSLADNDLSIDNIKLALEDIELGDDINAADLYASIVEEKSDTILMATLLRQSYKNPNIINKTYSNSTYEAVEKAIIYIIISVIAIVTYIISFSAKFRKILAKIIVPTIDVGIIFIFIMICLVNTDFDYYELFGNKTWLANLSILIISIVAYVLILYKFKNEIFRTACELLLPLGIISLLIETIYNVFYGYELALLVLGLIALIVFTVLTVLKRKNKLNWFLKMIYTFLLWTIKSLVFVFVLYILAVAIDNIFISFIICLIIYFVLNKFVFYRDNEKNTIKEELLKDKKIVINTTPMEILGIICGLGLILLVVGFMSITRNFASNVSSADISYSTQSSSSSDIDIDSNSAVNSREDYSGVNESIGSQYSITNPFRSVEKSTENSIEEKEIIDQETELDYQNTNEQLTTESVARVRNVFLESLAFIPELVTENGKTNLSVPISDNITTWSIQAIGNTKDGSIGYTNKEFKVFQDYFIDFSLPTNSVVGDKVSIPVTIYNYTDNNLVVSIDVRTNEWCVIGDYEKSINIESKGTKMVYVPIEIIKEGNNTLRIESVSENKSDIVEKNFTVKINGLEIEKVVSSGIITEDYSMDILYDESYIPGTEKLKLKIYPSPIVQTIENIEAMLELPTGCFEQTSSSLYPDILVLKYLKGNGISDSELKDKALDYISKGYQKLLTYEVKGTKGGYSLYGNNPAEPVITAFGLMEFKELSEVYEVDSNVLNKMKEYLFKNQNSDGSFNYSSTYIGGAPNTNKIAMTAYITWALSEAYPDDSRLEKSIKYLEGKIDMAEDNYTLALIANVLVNTGNDSSKVIKLLMDDLVVIDDGAYVSSNIKDYYGTYGQYQNIQATALTSIALSKAKEETKNNTELVNYLVSAKHPGGTWGTTQATILALKAVNEFSANSDISEQTITFNLNGKTNTLDIKKDILDYYEVELDGISKENKLLIGMKKGKIIYEVVKDYYIDYSELKESDKISLEYTITENANVNDEIIQSIMLKNNTNENIENGLIRINIPQGTSVIEDSLLELKYKGIIEKYEYNYNTINIYLRKVSTVDTYSFDIKYRALYPEEVTGGAVRFYDYYNPDVEAIKGPTRLTIR